MLAIIRQIFNLLTGQERIQAYWCFAAMLLMAIVDVLGVASIMPFIAVVANPEMISQHTKLAFVYSALHFHSPNRFLIFLGLMVLAILIIGNIISMFTTWAILRFTYARAYSLSKRLFVQYLYQPYIFFIDRNVSELSKNILSEVNTVINRAFIPGMQLIAKLIVSLFILLLLLIVDPLLAFVVLFVLGGAYTCIYMKVRSELSTISRRCLEYNKQKYKIVMEAYGGIKDIKLLGREDYFIQTFSYYAKQHARDEAMGNIISQLPRYALETIAFGGVLIIIIYLLAMREHLTHVMPLLALYAFASIRLMPALQQIFTSLAYLRMSKDALNILSSDLQRKLDGPTNISSSFHANDLPCQNAIELRNIYFSYNNGNKPVIESLNLTIPTNSTVGLVGMTGAGKTTVVDILLGLLTPAHGDIYIDAKPILSSNLRCWQKKIGYVPQTIFLADDTIINNIAFGVPPDEIDFAAIELAAKIANIHDFIVNELKEHYQTVVGERGIRLSGGQRQRIGIARALYHDPEILVLDEATNSLDNLTENAILDAILALSRKKTIMIIAHRITTLEACDMIYVLHEGKIISTDTYQGLLKTCAHFRNMAHVHT